MKSKLFELMGKLNPEFMINEEKPEDVKTMKDALTGSYVEIQKKKINTTDEFKPAFKVWFETLGFDPQKNKINPHRFSRDVYEALHELGYE